MATPWPQSRTWAAPRPSAIAGAAAALPAWRGRTARERAQVLRHWADLMLDGEVPQPQRTGQRMVVLKQPIRVCAAITPWNLPAAMITCKVGPALATGCTIVVKSAELTPLSAFALGVLALEAGLPPGILQIVIGDAPAIGAALCESDVVRKLSGQRLPTQLQVVFH